MSEMDFVCIQRILVKTTYAELCMMVISSVDYALAVAEEDVVSRILFKEISIGISSTLII